MKTCWAMHLGDCSDKVSGEHIISKSLIDSDSIEVYGLPWLNGKKKVIGKSSLTRNILCQKHNSDLSNIDTAAKEAFDSFRNMFGTANSQTKFDMNPQTIEALSIDGLLLERWFLKTLINIMYNNNFPIGNPIVNAGAPSNELIEIAFGRKAFDARSGLYVVFHDIQVYSFGRIEFTPIMKHDNSYVAGGVFSFGGPRFLLFCGIDQPPEHLKGINLGKADLSNSKLFYHPEKMDVSYGDRLLQQVNFRW